MTRLGLISALILSSIGVAALATPAASMRGAGIHMGAMGVARPMMGAPHVRMYSAPIGRSRAYAWQGQRHANFRRFHGRRSLLRGRISVLRLRLWLRIRRVWLSLPPSRSNQQFVLVASLPRLPLLRLRLHTRRLRFNTGPFSFEDTELPACFSA